MMKNIKWNQVIGWGLMIAILGWLAFGFFSPDTEETPEKNISALVNDVRQERVESIQVDGNRLTVTLDGGEEYFSIKEDSVSLLDLGVDPEAIDVQVEPTDDNSFWLNLLSSLIPFVIIFIFLLWILRRAQSGGNRAMMFGQSKAKMVVGEDREKVTFDDVAGAEQAKKELMEVVEFLKYPRKFHNVGAEIPKGVLLVGKPGTGKTLMARAVAGEAGVPFFNISGSEFVEMFVGVGASRVRDLFKKAKRNAPAIIFIDELDAVGRKRGAGLGGSHDEREQTLNQILVEMDGFEQETNVIVMAATNRPDVLDPALLRPGRFDRRVVVNLPDIEQRQAILKVHAKDKPVSDDVDFEQIAARTPGFSGADLENLLNEAAIQAARNNRSEIIMDDVDEAIEKVMLGPERSSSVMNDEEKKITAYHEAGHAIVGQILEQGDPIHKVSIVSRGQSLGFTWSMPTEERKLQSREKFKHDLAMMLGGRMAESMIFGDDEITTGAANDLKKATQLARKMVTKYGMSDKIGLLSLGHEEDHVFLGKEISEQQNYSDETAALIDEEVSRLINDAQELAVDVLKDNEDKLKAIAAKLMEKETLSKEEFESFFTDTPSGEAQ